MTGHSETPLWVKTAPRFTALDTILNDQDAHGMDGMSATCLSLHGQQLIQGSSNHLQPTIFQWIMATRQGTWSSYLCTLASFPRLPRLPRVPLWAVGLCWSKNWGARPWKLALPLPWPQDPQHIYLICEDDARQRWGFRSMGIPNSWLVFLRGNPRNGWWLGGWVIGLPPNHPWCFSMKATIHLGYPHDYGNNPIGSLIPATPANSVWQSSTFRPEVAQTPMRVQMTGLEIHHLRWLFGRKIGEHQR